MIKIKGMLLCDLKLSWTLSEFFFLLILEFQSFQTDIISRRDSINDCFYKKIQDKFRLIGDAELTGDLLRRQMKHITKNGVAVLRVVSLFFLVEGVNSSILY